MGRFAGRTGLTSRPTVCTGASPSQQTDLHRYRHKTCCLGGVRTATLLVIAFTVLSTSCSHATNGAASSNASSNQSAQESARTKPGSGAAANSANGESNGAVVPDPHASQSPNVGREAGVGDDPANLEVADPKENGGDSGKPGPAQKP